MRNAGIVPYYQQLANYWANRPDVIPTQHIEGHFGGTGAAGTGGTPDLPGHVDTGTVPGDIEAQIEVQIFSPQGSAGGSATSSSYSY